MNRNIRRMMQEIERRGGKIGLADSIPDEIAEQFLREVLDCPDCRTSRAEAASGDPKRRGNGH